MTTLEGTQAAKAAIKELKLGIEYLALEDNVNAFCAFERAQHLVFSAKNSTSVLAWGRTKGRSAVETQQ